MRSVNLSRGDKSEGVEEVNGVIEVKEVKGVNESKGGRSEIVKQVN